MYIYCRRKVLTRSVAWDRFTTNYTDERETGQRRPPSDRTRYRACASRTACTSSDVARLTSQGWRYVPSHFIQETENSTAKSAVEYGNYAQWHNTLTRHHILSTWVRCPVDKYTGSLRAFPSSWLYVLQLSQPALSSRVASGSNRSTTLTYSPYYRNRVKTIAMVFWRSR